MGFAVFKTVARPASWSRVGSTPMHLRQPNLISKTAHPFAFRRCPSSLSGHPNWAVFRDLLPICCQIDVKTPEWREHAFEICRDKSHHRGTRGSDRCRSQPAAPVGGRAPLSAAIPTASAAVRQSHLCRRRIALISDAALALVARSMHSRQYWHGLCEQVFCDSFSEGAVKWRESES